MTKQTETNSKAPTEKRSRSRHIHTEGGTYIEGDVYVSGDFIERDRTETPPATAPMPPARPALPATGDPLALIAAALQARRLLLVWTEVPFLPAEHPPRNPAQAITQWQKDARSLPPFTWPVSELPPLSILSLDPTDRIEHAFHQANVSLNVLRARSDVITPSQHNLIKLGGDLEIRSGLFLSWDDVRVSSNDADKAHLLREAGRVAQEGVVLVAGAAVNAVFTRIWETLIALHLREAACHFAAGPADFTWPAPLQYLDIDSESVLTVLRES